MNWQFHFILLFPISIFIDFYYVITSRRRRALHYLEDTQSNEQFKFAFQRVSDSEGRMMIWGFRGAVVARFGNENENYWK